MNLAFYSEGPGRLRPPPSESGFVPVLSLRCAAPIADGGLEPTKHDRDLTAAALNERFVELGRDHPLRYTEDDATNGSP